MRISDDFHDDFKTSGRAAAIVGEMFASLLLISAIVSTSPAVQTQMPTGPVTALDIQLLLDDVKRTRQEAERLQNGFLAYYCPPPDRERRWDVPQLDIDQLGQAADELMGRFENLRQRFNDSHRGRPQGAFTTGFPTIENVSAEEDRYWPMMRLQVLKLQNFIKQTVQNDLNARKRPCRESQQTNKPGPGVAPPADPLADLIMPTPQTVNPVHLPTSFCSEGERRAALAEAAVELKKAWANAEDASEYAAKVRARLLPYAQAGGNETIRAALRKKEAEAIANKATHDARAELAWQIYEGIKHARVVDCTPRSQSQATGASSSDEKKFSFSVFGGVSGSNSPTVVLQPLPAGAAFTAPNGRPSQIISTWLFQPGTDYLNGVEASLGKTAKMQSLDSVLQSAFPDEIMWDFGGGIRRKLPLPKFRSADAYFDVTDSVGSGRLSTAELHQLLDQAVAFFLQQLFDGATEKSATGTVSTTGGYSGTITYAGGLAVYPWSNVVVKGGASYVSVLGDPTVTQIRFDYGFTGGGVPFKESDQVDLRYESSGGFGFQAGAGYESRLSQRLRLFLDAMVTGYHRDDRIFLSAHPTSTPGAARGAAAFSTPAGSPTIVFSSIPGVPTSLSGTATDYPSFSSSRFVWAPHLRVGLRF